MTWQTVLAATRDALRIELVELGGETITLGGVLAFVLVLVSTFWVSRIGRRGVRRFLTGRGISDEATVGVVGQFFHYLVLLAGFGVALHMLGVNLGALFAAGALFAVAIGFAMQNIASNFVSGVILLAERAIKPGDVLEVEGKMVRVREMGIRATIARTLDDEDLILPNSQLVQSTVKNYTLRDPMVRLRVEVGVVYGSDMRQVMEVLAASVRELEWRSKQRDPVVLMIGFGSSSVDFEVSVWSGDPWRSRRHGSEMRQAIWWALKDAGITIAFPQLDLHLDEAGLEALRGASRPSST